MFKIGDRVKIISENDMYGWTGGLIVGNTYIVGERDTSVGLRLIVDRVYHSGGMWWVPESCVEHVFVINEQLLLFELV